LVLGFSKTIGSVSGTETSLDDFALILGSEVFGSKPFPILTKQSVQAGVAKLPEILLLQY
jgi:hypothetical protein